MTDDLTFDASIRACIDELTAMSDALRRSDYARAKDHAAGTVDGLRKVARDRRFVSALRQQMTKMVPRPVQLEPVIQLVEASNTSAMWGTLRALIVLAEATDAAATNEEHQQAEAAGR